MSAIGVTMVTRIPRKVAKAGNNASRDPPENNSNHAESGLFGDGSSGGRNVNKMMQLNTIEYGVSDADVREVHAGGLLLIPGLLPDLISAYGHVTPQCGGASVSPFSS